MKPKLPIGWIAVVSKKHPNRVYYFNVKTNKSSWDIPVDQPEPNKRGKKRKTSDTNENGNHRPTTPEDDISKAKRRASNTKQKTPPTQSAPAGGSKDTPQMRQLREKMLERRAKGNASKKSKVTSKAATKDESADTTDPKEELSLPIPSGSQSLTPQMRVLLEKMKERKVKGRSKPKSPAKNEVIEARPKLTPVKRTSARSLGSTESNDTAKQIRRSSRRTINANATSVRADRMASSTSSFVEPLGNASLAAETVGSSHCSSLQETPKVSPKRRRRSSTAQSKDETPPAPQQSLPRPRGSALKKNQAEERLSNLRESLNDSLNAEVTPPPPERVPQNARILLHDVSTIWTDKSSPPSIYKNSAMRSKMLRERLNNKSLYEKRMSKSVNTESLNESVEPNSNVSQNSSEPFCEEMDWEPIEDDQIMQEIEMVRSYIGAMDYEPIPEVYQENSLDLPDGPSRVQNKSLYMVIDTNVFLSNLDAIAEARDAVFRTFGQPVIVIPWTVIRELDFIKDDRLMKRSESLRMKARQAVRFLHQHFSARHPRFLGQTPADVANNKSRFEIDCPDDEILQTCLQIRTSNNCVVLLSYDKNLCTKAMIHDIATLGRHDPLEKVDYLHASDVRNDSFLVQHLRGETRDEEVLPIFVRESRVAEEILEEAKEVLTSFLTVVVVKAMQNLYSDQWEKSVLIRPPWTVVTVLKCAIKHWIAAVSDSFARRAEPLLKELLEAMSKFPESGRRLSDVSHILETINDLVQYVNIDKHQNIAARSSRAIAELKVKCLNAMRKLNQEKLHDAIGFEKSEEARADTAFQQFEEVYSFARDLCGLASETIGMPCSFTYKKLNPLPTEQNLKAMQPDVAANLNRLLQVLSTALEEINSLHTDHRAVVALYNALSTFMPDQVGRIPRDFSPVDVYWCLKTKEKLLRSGLSQLQELSGQFCRMASFRCT